MKHMLRRLMAFLPMTALLCGALTVPALAEGEEAAQAILYGTWWALLPPFIAIFLALITKEAYGSLFIGVVVGAFLSSNFHPVNTLNAIVQDGLMSAVETNAGIFIFLALLGIVVALMNAAGGSAAFGRWAEKNIHSRVGVQLATFLLGILIFIDDYFNCLTVGSVMRPVTDRQRVSRPKLAYLIDATAAPVCMIAPVSSWAAAVSGTAEKLDTGISGIELFIRAIPYNLYSLLTFLFILLLVLLGFDYGPMRRFEKLAIRKGELSGLPGSVETEENHKGRVIDLLFPVLLLIITCTLGMLYVGGFFGVDWWGGTDNKWNVIGALSNTDAFIGLPWGSIIALVLIVAYILFRGCLTFQEAMACVSKGFNAMGSPIIILTLAVSLKTMTNDKLGAAQFVHDAMTGAADHLYSMLPAVIFLVACVLAFASGTSWGTFGILIPIVIAIFPSSSPLMIIGISACLAGAVCGDHCSPISDTTIMASAGAQVEHIDHVSTQLPYALTVAAVSFVGFIVAGFFQDLYLTWGISAITLMAILLILRIAVFFIERREQKQEENEALRAAALRAEEAARKAQEQVEYPLMNGGSEESAPPVADKTPSWKNEPSPTAWSEGPSPTWADSVTPPKFPEEDLTAEEAPPVEEEPPIEEAPAPDKSADMDAASDKASDAAPDAEPSEGDESETVSLEEEARESDEPSGGAEEPNETVKLTKAP